MSTTSWVIGNDDATEEPEYWSNEFGWTSLEGADEFRTAEREFLRLPLGGRWIKLHEPNDA